MNNKSTSSASFLKRTLQLIGWLFSALIIQLSFQSVAASAGSLDFTGGTGNVTVPYSSRIDVESGAFTIEMFVKETERLNNNVTASVWISSAGGYWGSGDAGSGAISLANSDCGYSRVNGSNAVTVLGHYGQDCALSSESSRSDYLNDRGWHHIAISKTATNGSIQMYIDGTRVVYWANDNSYWGLEHKGTFGNLNIGGGFKGYISNIRLVKGQGLYTGTTISVPTSTLTTTSQGAIAANVSLLLTSESAANLAVDTSPTPSVLTNSNALYAAVDPFLITPTFTWSGITKTMGDAPFTITAPTPSTPGTFTYSSATPGVIALNNVNTDSATVVSSGSSVITATFTPTNSAVYRSSTTTMTVTVNKMLQSAVSVSLSPTTKVIKSGFSQVLTTLNGSGGSGTGAFSYTVTTVTAGANCALANNAGIYTLSADTAGTCTLTATRASDASYQAGSASTNFIFSTPVRTLSFATTAYTLAYLATQQLTATASANGGPTVITYSAGVSTACSVDANTGIVSITASTGTCTISASVAEDVTYLATSTVTPASITVGKANQAPVTLSISPTSKNGLAPFTQQLVTLSATGGTGTGVLAYTIADVTAGATCQLTSNAGVYTVTAATAGTCSITATKPADTNYLVSSDSKTFSFNSNRTLTYAAGLGGGVKSGITAPTAGPFLTGDTFVIAAGSAYERAGFSFTGWSDGTNTFAAGDNYTVASANITLTAQWRQTSLFGILDADLEEMQSWNASSNTNSGTISNAAGTSSVTVTVPANSLTTGTTVKLWELKNSDFAKSKVDPSKDYIVNLVLSWLKDNGVGQAQTVPIASSPITVSISNNTIKKGAIAYQIIGDVVTEIGTATADGVLNISITEDPVITIANPIVQNNNGGGGGNGGGNNVAVSVEVVAEPIKPVVVPPTTIRKTQVTHKVFFGLNASWINSVNIRSLKGFLSNLAIDTKINEVLIQGFTQPTFINPDPAGLSKARANSVAKLIKAQGINSKITAVGKGNGKKNSPTSRYVLVTVTGESKS